MKNLPFTGNQNIEMCYSPVYKSDEDMKIPTNGSGNGYYGHHNGVITFLENEEVENDMQSPEAQFADYMWMEHEEEFDKQVLQQLEEEELMEECLEAMLEEERQHHRNQTSSAWATATSATENNGAELCQQLNSLRVHDELAKQSTLNPNAAEFIPTVKSTLSNSTEISAKSS